MAKKRFRIKRGFTLIPLRIFLALIIFSLIFSGGDELALYLFVLTALVAFLDGFLAKKSKVSGQLRGIFDPFADKFLINLIAVALFFKGILPFWVMGVYLVKDLLVVIGALFVLVKNTRTIFTTNVIDKVSVFIQMFTLFVVLMGVVDYVLVWASVGFVFVSFISTLFKSGVRVVRYKTELEEIRFRKLLQLPDLFTFLNI